MNIKLLSLSTLCLGVLMTLCIASPQAANAGGLIAPGNYTLHNHPDGGARPPLYGLRLDKLTGSGIHTFDFDHPDAGMTLTYDGNSMHITGKVYGGLNSGSGYANVNTGKVGLWAVDFTYHNVSMVVGDDDLHVLAAFELNTNPVTGNNGSITKLFDDNQQYDLVDYAGGHSYTVRLGDENNDNGHRGFNGISVWGWVNHYIDGQTSSTVHHAASDWLFTMENQPNPNTDVPEPASIALLGAGALALMRRPNRRKAA